MPLHPNENARTPRMNEPASIRTVCLFRKCSAKTSLNVWLRQAQNLHWFNYIRTVNARGSAPGPPGARQHSEPRERQLPITAKGASSDFPSENERSANLTRNPCLPARSAAGRIGGCQHSARNVFGANSRNRTSTQKTSRQEYVLGIRAAAACARLLSCTESTNTVTIRVIRASLRAAEGRIAGMPCTDRRFS